MSIQTDYDEFQEDLWLGQMVDVGDPPRVVRGEAAAACRPGDLVVRTPLSGGTDTWTPTIAAGRQLGVVVYDHRRAQASDGTINYADGDEIQVLVRGAIKSDLTAPGTAAPAGTTLTHIHPSNGTTATSSGSSRVAVSGIKTHRSSTASQTNIVVQLTDDA